MRDRFEGAADRVLDLTEFGDWAVTAVAALRPLRLVDLRTSGPLLLGVSTDVVHVRDHAEGRRFSAMLYDHSDEIDGLLYRSRLTGADCLAIYDRAVTAALVATPALPLVRLRRLVPALKSLAITIRVDAD